MTPSQQAKKAGLKTVNFVGNRRMSKTKEIDVYLYETSYGLEIILQHESSNDLENVLIGRGKAVISMLDDTEIAKRKILALKKDRSKLYDGCQVGLKNIDERIKAIENTVYED